MKLYQFKASICLGFTLACSLLFSQLLYGQQIDTNTTTHRPIKDPSVNDIYIPPKSSVTSAKKKAGANIEVNYIGNSWDPHEKAAFEYAVKIWESAIQSPQKITINAEWKNLGSNTLAAAKSKAQISDFCNNCHPEYESNTWFPVALGEKMIDQDAWPYPEIEVDVNSNSSIDFYFEQDGKTPDNEYDFVTVVLHEIAHGLGFSSTAWDSSGTLTYMDFGQPNIYDTDVEDGSGTVLTSFPNTSSSLTNFLESGNLLFAGLFASFEVPPYGPELYAPNDFVNGSSISHLSESVWGDSLMAPSIAQSEAKHRIDVILAAILKDLGWGDVTATGIEDEIKIYANSDTVQQLGGQFNFYWDFIDYSPTGDYIPGDGNYVVKIIHDDGEYIHSSGTASELSNFTFTVNSLPSGYEWQRTYTGEVRAELEVTATDNDNVTHTDRQTLSLYYRPDTPEVEVQTFNIVRGGGKSVYFGGRNCNKVELSYFADGAHFYEVSYREIGEVVWNNVKGVTTKNTCEITGLKKEQTYEFRVMAVNTDPPHGEQFISKIDTHTVCPPLRTDFSDPGNGPVDDIVVAIPNPARDIVRLRVPSERVNIRIVEARKMDNPIIGKVKQVNPPELVPELDISQLPEGVYAVEVTNVNNQQRSGKFIIKR